MAKKVVNTTKISHEEWLNLRKLSIGGSDAGALMGMNSYKGQIGVYADKMGLVEPTETNEAMRLGNDLEAYVAERFTEKTGKKVRNDNFMYSDDEYEFITANIDRVVVGENAGLECKTMSSFSKWDLENGEVPATYYCQCQHYMMVMGFERMYLCVLVFQRGVYVVPIARDEKFIENLRTIEVDFWKTYIEQKVMPSPQSEEDRETLSELYPTERDRDEEIYIDRLDSVCKDIDAHEAQKKFHENKIKHLKAIIQSELKDVARGYSDGYKVSWLSQSRTTVDGKRLEKELPDVYAKYTKTTQSRPLRISKKK